MSESYLPGAKLSVRCSKYVEIDKPPNIKLSVGKYNTQKLQTVRFTTHQFNAIIEIIVQLNKVSCSSFYLTTIRSLIKNTTVLKLFVMWSYLFYL